MNQRSLETEMKLIYLIEMLPLGTCSLTERILTPGQLNWASGFVFRLWGNNMIQAGLRETLKPPTRINAVITPFDLTVSLLTKISTVLTVKRKSSFWTGKRLTNPPQERGKTQFRNIKMLQIGCFPRRFHRQWITFSPR